MIMKRLFVLYIETNGCGDGSNIFTSRHVLVSSDHLTFSEPMFHGQNNLPLISQNVNSFIREVTALGYIAEDMDEVYVSLVSI